MLTHNVNPQTLPNQPGRNQVHRSVVSNLKYSKPARKVFRATPPMSTRQGSPVRSTTRILAPALVVDGADAPMSHPPSAEAGFAVGPGTPGGEALPASAPETDPMVMPSESAFAYRPFSDEPLPSAVSQQLDNNPKSYKVRARALFSVDALQANRGTTYLSDVHITLLIPRNSHQSLRG